MNRKADDIRVCLIEDDELVVKAVRQAMRDRGDIRLDVEFVETAAELDALPMRLKTQNHQVLIVDLGLPGKYKERAEKFKNGLTLLRELHAAGIQAARIVLTAYPQDQTLVNSAGAGAMTFIAKKGEETWRELLVRVDAAYAYWQAEEGRRQLARLANQMVHDLKNPLCAASWAMDFVRSQPTVLDQQFLQSLAEAIKDACDDSLYLHDLLRQLADGRSLVRKTNVTANADWASVFESIKRRSRLFALGYGEVAQLEFDNKFHGTLPLDVALFKRAVFNLVVNSLAAMKENEMLQGDGRLSLRAEGKAKFLEFEIEDNAGGIEPERLEHSTGLGFGICREIIEEVHKGNVECARLGKGTRFTLRLPIRAD